MTLYFELIKLAIIGALGLVLIGCETIAPKDGGTMRTIQQELKVDASDGQTPREERVPPPAISQALLPPLDLQVAPEVIPQEDRFDVNVATAPVRDFLMGLVDGTPYNMVVHPQVSGTISLSLKQVTIPDVMEVLRDVYGYEFQRSRSGYHVLPMRLQSRIFQVNYLNVVRSGSSKTRVSSGQVSDSSSDDDESSDSSGDGTSGSQISTTYEADYWAELQASLITILGDAKGRSVVVSPQSGLVVVRGMPQELREIETYLSATNEVMHRQVVLEAKLIEVELNDGYQAGVNWAKLMQVNGDQFSIGQAGGANPFQNPGAEGVTLPSGGITDPTATSPVGFTGFKALGGFFGAAINTGNFLAFIELLESQGNVQVLSSPRISTLNNQKAVIKVGSDEFFVTDISTTTTTGTATTTTPDITLTPFFSGVALDVTPQIDQNGGITLHIHPSVSRVTDQQKIIQVGNDVQNLPLAKSTVRESDSVVFAQSGQLVVIGGLMQDTRSEQVASTPVLGDIPIFGQLFRQTRQAAKKSELILLLRPTVVDSDQGWGRRVSHSAQRIKQLDKGFHQGSQSAVFGNLGEK